MTEIIEINYSKQICGCGWVVHTAEKVLMIMFYLSSSDKMEAFDVQHEANLRVN